MPRYTFRGDELIDGRDSYPPVRTAPWDDGLRVDDPPWISRYPWRNELARLPDKVRAIWRLRWARLSAEYEARGVPFPQHESMAWKVVKGEIAEGKFPEPEEEPIREPTPEIEVAKVEPKKKSGRGREQGGGGYFA